MNEIVQFGVRGNRQQLQIGDPISIGHSESDTVILPNGSLAAISTPDGAAPQSVATFEGTDSPGIYRIARSDGVMDSERQTAFAVNVDPLESDSRTLSQEDFLRRFPNAAFQWNNGRARSVRTLGSVDRPNPLTVALLMLAGAMLLVEQVMAWRFVWGLMLLVVVLVLIAALPWMNASSFAVPLLLVTMVLVGAGFVIRRMAGK